VSPPSLPRVPYRFSIFEADPQSGELRKNGVRLRIQDQPFQILLRLLERPGQIVTREELKTTLWAEQFCVDARTSRRGGVERSLAKSTSGSRHANLSSYEGYINRRHNKKHESKRVYTLTQGNKVEMGDTVVPLPHTRLALGSESCHRPKPNEGSR
jgi:hypothetical protein